MSNPKPVFPSTTNSKRTRSQLTLPESILQVPLARSPLKDARSAAKSNHKHSLKSDIVPHPTAVTRPVDQVVTPPRTKHPVADEDRDDSEDEILLSPMKKSHKRRSSPISGPEPEDHAETTLAQGKGKGVEREAKRARRTPSPKVDPAQGVEQASGETSTPIARPPHSKSRSKPKSKSRKSPPSSSRSRAGSSTSTSHQPSSPHPLPQPPAPFDFSFTRAQSVPIHFDSDRIPILPTPLPTTNPIPHLDLNKVAPSPWRSPSKSWGKGKGHLRVASEPLMECLPDFEGTPRRVVERSVGGGDGMIRGTLPLGFSSGLVLDCTAPTHPPSVMHIPTNDTSNTPKPTNPNPHMHIPTHPLPPTSLPSPHDLSSPLIPTHDRLETKIAPIPRVDYGFVDLKTPVVKTFVSRKYGRQGGLGVQAGLSSQQQPTSKNKNKAKPPSLNLVRDGSRRGEEEGVNSRPHGSSSPTLRTHWRKSSEGTLSPLTPLPDTPFSSQMDGTGVSGRSGGEERSSSPFDVDRTPTRGAGRERGVGLGFGVSAGIGLMPEGMSGFGSAREGTPGLVGERTPGFAVERTPGPAWERTPGPAREQTPVITRERTPAPARERTPGPAQEQIPGITRERTPGPTRERTPGPTRERTPGLGLGPPPHLRDGGVKLTAGEEELDDGLASVEREGVGVGMKALSNGEEVMPLGAGEEVTEPLRIGEKVIKPSSKGRPSSRGEDVEEKPGSKGREKDGGETKPSSRKKAKPSSKGEERSTLKGKEKPTSKGMEKPTSKGKEKSPDEMDVFGPSTPTPSVKPPSTPSRPRTPIGTAIARKTPQQKSTTKPRSKSDITGFGREPSIDRGLVRPTTPQAAKLGEGSMREFGTPSGMREFGSSGGMIMGRPLQTHPSDDMLVDSPLRPVPPTPQFGSPGPSSTGAVIGASAAATGGSTISVKSRLPRRSLAPSLSVTGESVAGPSNAPIVQAQPLEPSSIPIASNALETRSTSQKTVLKTKVKPQLKKAKSKSPSPEPGRAKSSASIALRGKEGALGGGGRVTRSASVALKQRKLDDMFGRGKVKEKEDGDGKKRKSRPSTAAGGTDSTSSTTTNAVPSSSTGQPIGGNLEKRKSMGFSFAAPTASSSSKIVANLGGAGQTSTTPGKPKSRPSSPGKASSLSALAGGRPSLVARPSIGGGVVGTGAGAKSTLSNLSMALEKLSLPPPSRPNTSMGFTRDGEGESTDEEDGAGDRVVSRDDSMLGGLGVGRRKSGVGVGVGLVGAGLGVKRSATVGHVRTSAAASGSSSNAAVASTSTTNLVKRPSSILPVPTSQLKSTIPARRVPGAPGSATGVTGAHAKIFGAGGFVKGKGRIFQKASQKPALPDVEGSPVKGGGSGDVVMEDLNVSPSHKGKGKARDVDMDEGDEDVFMSHDSDPPAAEVGSSTPEGHDKEKGAQLARTGSWKHNVSRRASLASQALTQSLSSLPQTPTAPEPIKRLGSMGPPPVPGPSGSGKTTRSVSSTYPSSTPTSTEGQGETRSGSGRPVRNATIAGRSAPGTLGRGAGHVSTGRKGIGGKNVGGTGGGSLEVLDGCVIFVDVRTDDGDDAGGLFVEMLKGLGAKILARAGQTCTHIVFKNGLMSTLTRLKLMHDPKPHVVGIAWVVECVEQRAKVDETKFLVDLEGVGVAGTNKRRRSMLPKQIPILDHGTPETSPPIRNNSAQRDLSDAGDHSMDASSSSVDGTPVVNRLATEEESLPPLERARRRRSMLVGPS